MSTEKRVLLFSVTIEDCDVQTFASGGPGGQHQNKTASGVRIVHTASGAVGESREDRSQHTNKRIAFRRMVKTKAFRDWHQAQVREILTGRTVEQLVDEAMDPKNLRIEVRGPGGWELEPRDMGKSLEGPINDDLT